MKNKKLTINLISHLAQMILQHRISPTSQFFQKISRIQQQIQNMHYQNSYQLDLYSSLIEHEQYDIERRLNSKTIKVLTDGSICIKFKVIQKQKFFLEHMEAWVISYSKLQIKKKNEKQNFSEELISLLQSVLRSLKCQFLFSELINKQQIKKKFIIDYQIEFNPSKKQAKKNSPLFYQKIWKKEARVDLSNYITVTCYHNQSERFKSIIKKQHEKLAQFQDINQLTLTNTIPAKVKRSSQQTHACTSGEYQCSDTYTFECFDLQNTERNRKNSVIEFYDEELNITVLSNDSDSFKKSTGKISGVYGEQYEDHQSEDDFEIMIQQSRQEELLRSENQSMAQLNYKLTNLLQPTQKLYSQMDELILQYF